ncbi:MAG: trp RNA-binding attenuation protein MtrB [Synergistaceae bacterium]|nr:trp RNA-binding attenuation protein MtrB [Synergistaceae bacterium]
MMDQNSNEFSKNGEECVVVKALEDGVTVIGVTRGTENKILHTENLKKGEIWIAQFTEHISAMKIRGVATVLTKYGKVDSGK